MNRIIKEAIKKIDIAKSSIINNDKIDILDGIINIIRYGYKNTNYLLNDFENISFILINDCHLNNNEIGFIFNKIMQHNINLNKKDDFIVIEKDFVKHYNFSINQEKILLNAYINNKLTDNVKILIDDFIKNENIRLLHIKNTYKFIESFIKNNNHTENEYILFKQALDSIYVPNELEIAYMVFFRNRENKISPLTKHKNEIIKRLSNDKLNELYKEDAHSPYFDMVNIKELMKSLYNLNISDEKIYNILTNLYSKVLENDNYYNFLIEKAKYMYLYQDTINEIINLKDALLKSDDESKIIVKELLVDLYKTLKPVMTKSFDYEMSLYSKVKKKV